MAKQNPEYRLTARTEEVLAQAAEHVGRMEEESAGHGMWVYCLESLGHSPIEQMFMCGLRSVARVNVFELYVSPNQRLKVPSEEVPRMAQEVGQRMEPIVCLTQAKIGQYRADFVLYLNEGPFAVPTVIELDGHQWHERTQEQRESEKKRDRFMQFRGLRVGRYTGSEVFNDPFRVAADALNLTIGTDDYFITADEYWGR